MSSDFHHDLLKFGWSNKPIIIRIKVPECLPDSFSSESFQELGEFLESDNMVSAPFT